MRSRTAVIAALAGASISWSAASGTGEAALGARGSGVSTSQATHRGLPWPSLPANLHQLLLTLFPDPPDPYIVLPHCQKLLAGSSCPEGYTDAFYGPEQCGSNGEGQGGDGGKDKSDPINLATGDYQLVQTDLTLPGRGLDLVLTRYYRSMSGIWSLFGGGNHHDPAVVTAQPLGMNWDHSLNIRIDYLASNDPDVFPAAVFLQPGDGRRENWVFDHHLTDDLDQTRETVYYTRPGSHAVLEFTRGTETFRLIDGAHTVYTFQSFHDLAPGAGGNVRRTAGVSSIADRNGNTLSFSYGPTAPGRRPVLQSVADELGQSFSFTYLTVGDYDLLETATDSLGRTVTYTYDDPIEGWDDDVDTEVAKIQLISAALPAIVNGGSHFNLPADQAGRFASGRVWHFEWHDDEYAGADRQQTVYTGAPTLWWGGQIHRVIDPNGNAVVENEYNTIDKLSPTALTSWAYNPDTYWVSRQMHGGSDYDYELTDDSGQPLETVGVDTSGGLTNDSYSVWVTDRRGHVTRLDYLAHAVARPAEDGDGGGDLTHTQRRLVRKVEFNGRVTKDVSDRDDRVWGTIDSSGNVTAWHGAGAPANPVGVGPWVTSYEFNDDWHASEVTHPSGLIVSAGYTGDAAPSGADPREGGGLSSSTVTNGTDGITETWTHDFSFGGCCGSDFPTSHTDANGNLTVFQYDPVTGDRLAVHRGVTDPNNPATSAVASDEYQYNAFGQVTQHTGPAFMTASGAHRAVTTFGYGTAGYDLGRMVSRTVDPAGLALQTAYAYDALGNVREVVEPDGGTTRRLFNQAGWLVREQRFEPGGSVLLAQTDWYHDAEGNVVREEVADVVAGAVAQKFTTVHVYDELGFRIATAREIGGFSGTITEDPNTGRIAFANLPSGTNWTNEVYVYDADRNLIEVVRQEDAIGDDDPNDGIDPHPDERTRFVYDELGRLHRRIDGAASSSDNTGLLVTEYAYDEDGRTVSVTLNPDGAPRQTTFAYDDLGRLITTTDPMGNESWTAYDPNGNVVESWVLGELDDVDNSAGNQLLAYTITLYDALNRPYRTETADFDPNTATPPALPGDVTTFAVQETVYNANGSVYQRTSQPHAVGGTASWIASLHDAAGRLTRVTDPLGNRVDYAYDAGSNLASVTSREYFSRDGAVLPQQFRTSFAYDALDRRISTTEVLGYDAFGSPTGGNTTTYTYDSRGNLTAETDPRGNDTEHEYDGLSRLVETRVLGVANAAAGGAGGDTTIVTQTTYDDLSRVVALTDDNANTTTYAHDALGREVLRTMPDGKTASTAYNALGDPVLRVDERGVEVTSTFDAAGRVLTRTIDASADPEVFPQADTETFAYDGLGRIRLAQNAATRVVRFYDSRSMLIEEVQNADAANGFPAASDRVVACAPDAAGNDILCVYPSGREVHRTFDSLGRITGIYAEVDGQGDPVPASLLGSYDYVGPGRIDRRTSGNGVVASWTYGGHTSASGAGTAQQGFGRPLSVTHTHPTAGGVDAREFTWDAAGNRTGHSDVRAAFTERRTRLFGYDGANRLVSSESLYPLSATLLPTETDYILDGVHNRVEVQSIQTPGADGTDTAGALVGEYLLTGDNAKNNQYSASPTKVYAYDLAGNQTLRADLRRADFNDDYHTNVNDLLGFLGAFRDGDPSADIDGNGVVDVNDELMFLGLFQTHGGTTREHEHFVYDHANRLRKYERYDGPSTLRAEAEFVYDVFGRRVLETFETDTDLDGILDEVRHAQLVYGGQAGWQLLEEISSEIGTIAASGGPVVLASHVFGVGIDEVLTSTRDLDGDGTADSQVWLHQDDMGTVYAATGGGGIVVERYAYGDYGLPTILDPDGVTVRDESTIGNRFGFTGREWLAAIELYDYRHRMMEPRTGRFVQRDPLAETSNVLSEQDSANLYAYVRSNPGCLVDPDGLIAIAPWLLPAAPAAPALAPIIVPVAAGCAIGFAAVQTIETVKNWPKDRTAKSWRKLSRRLRNSKGCREAKRERAAACGLASALGGCQSLNTSACQLYKGRADAWFKCASSRHKIIVACGQFPTDGMSRRISDAMNAGQVCIAKWRSCLASRQSQSP